MTRPEIYPELRALLGAHGDDDRVRDFLAPHRAKPPSLSPGSGFASVDVRRIGVRLLFWVGWSEPRMPARYLVEVGTLVEAQLFQEGIDRHKAFTGALPRDLRVDMSRDELVRALGQPTELCTCGQEPPCFLAWHVRDFDPPLEAHVTHHAKHAGRTKPRPGRVDLSIHLPRVP